MYLSTIAEKNRATTYRIRTITKTIPITDTHTYTYLLTCSLSYEQRTYKQKKKYFKTNEISRPKQNSTTAAATTTTMTTTTIITHQTSTTLYFFLTIHDFLFTSLTLLCSLLTITFRAVTFHSHSRDSSLAFVWFLLLLLPSSSS